VLADGIGGGRMAVTLAWSATGAQIAGTVTESYPDGHGRTQGVACRLEASLVAGSADAPNGRWRVRGQVGGVHAEAAEVAERFGEHLSMALLQGAPVPTPAAGPVRGAAATARRPD